MVGETPNTFYLLQQAYDDNGKPLDGKYIAKDGSVTSSEEDANKYVTGKSSKAPYYCGLSTRLTYKNWDLGINGHGSFGAYVYNYVKASDSLPLKPDLRRIASIPITSWRKATSSVSTTLR